MVPVQDPARLVVGPDGGGDGGRASREAAAAAGAARAAGRAGRAPGGRRRRRRRRARRSVRRQPPRTAQAAAAPRRRAGRPEPAQARPADGQPHRRPTAGADRPGTRAEAGERRPARRGRDDRAAGTEPSRPQRRPSGPRPHGGGAPADAHGPAPAPRRRGAARSAAAAGPRPAAAPAHRARGPYRARGCGSAGSLLVLALGAGHAEARGRPDRAGRRPRRRRPSGRRITDIALPAERGAILDRAGNPLAFSVDARALVTNPRADRRATTGATLPQYVRPRWRPAVAQATGAGPRPTLRGLLTSDKGYVVLAKLVDPDVARALREQFPEIAEERREDRQYPAGTLAANVDRRRDAGTPTSAS